MADMCSIKEMIQYATLGIPKGMKKYNFYFHSVLSIAFCLDFLSEMEI